MEVSGCGRKDCGKSSRDFLTAVTDFNLAAWAAATPAAWKKNARMVCMRHTDCVENIFQYWFLRRLGTCVHYSWNWYPPWHYTHNVRWIHPAWIKRWCAACSTCHTSLQVMYRTSGIPSRTSGSSFGHFRVTPWLLPGYPMANSRLPHKHFQVTPCALPGYPMDNSRLPHEHFQVTS